MDITSVLTSLGVSGQIIAYVSAAITIGTILLKVLPEPSQNGAYKQVYDVFSRIANLTIQPSNVHTVPTSLPPSQ